ncbi:hypothetical protein [Streptomyces chryseus]|uniref:hypothetical protein n=1 Tax=Streptomyces chryseus TaxID=68186 RepID=UPI003570CC6E
MQAAHGLPVSGRAMGMVPLVVSELVTNARKYAPALVPFLLTPEVNGGAVEVSVWDNPTPPAILTPGPISGRTMSSAQIGCFRHRRAHACGVERRRTDPSSAARSASDSVNSAFGRPIRAMVQASSRTARHSA